MKVRIHPQEDGRYLVIAKKTRRDENPTRVVSGITRADLAAQLAVITQEVAPTAKQAPLISP